MTQPISWRQAWLSSLLISGFIMLVAVPYGLSQKGTGGWVLPSEFGQLLGAALVTIAGNLIAILATVFTPMRKISACMALLLIPTVLLNAKLAVIL